jgi:hypothetical protein
VNKLVESLRRTGFRKGVAGSNTAWFAVWAGISAARFARKRLGRKPEIVERIVLHPGEAVEIRDTSVTWGEVKA